MYGFLQDVDQTVLFSTCSQTFNVRFFRSFAEPLEQVISLRGYLLVSKTDDER